MLEQLKLNNLALAVQAEVDFTPGMICITGETGAGKSLVIDALSLVLGAKADVNLVRQGQKQLEVSALFSIAKQSEVKALLAQYGYLPEDKVKSPHSRTRAPAANTAITTVSTAVATDATTTATASVSTATTDTAIAATAVTAAVVSSPLAAIAPMASLNTAITASAATPVISHEGVAQDVIGDTSFNMPPVGHTVVEGAGAVTLAPVTTAAELQCAVVADEHAGRVASGLPLPLSSAYVDTLAPLAEAAFTPSYSYATADDNDESDDLILRRVVSAEGKSKAYINGHMATLAQLREIAAGLVAIHGQHASMQLINEKHQLEIVDNFGKLRPLVTAVNDAYNQYSKLRTDLLRLSEEQKQGAAVYKQDRYELDELKRLDLHEGDYEQLEARFDKAMHQAQFSYALTTLRNMIEGGDANMLSVLRERLMDLDQVKAYDAGLEKIMANLEAAMLHLEDSSALAADLLTQDLTMSPNELEERMSKVHELARRFSCAPADLYMMTERLERKVKDFWALRDRINEVTEEVRAARNHYEDLAAQLTSQRSAVAQDFSCSVNHKIKALALPDARFDVCLSRDSEGKPRLNGRDQLCFMFSANLGQELKPLSAVASGGELSRLALTIEVLTASVRSTPTLIFDEVDTGISGRTASAVGALLKELGQYVQVITVTHLPQVAAKANTQFVVAKYSERGEVNSTISQLDTEGRIEEISRMIGGSVITDTTRKSAYELLHDI